MSTDTIRKLIEKFNAFFYLQIGDVSVAKWRMYFPSADFNKELNCLTISFYDCSYVSRSYLSKKHLLDLHFNNYPKWKYLSLCGFTFWFPYTWEEIKEKTCCKLAGSDIEEYIQLNKSINKELTLLKKEAKDLIYYADMCALILKQNGYEGKAAALETRYLKLGKRLGLTPDGPNAKQTKDGTDITKEDATTLKKSYNELNPTQPLEEEPK